MLSILKRVTGGWRNQQEEGDENVFVIAGLGNPGREYAGTRHNIGFDAITRLSDEYNIPLDFKKHKALCGKGVIAGRKVILAQPQTYMNLSGESVRELADYYKISVKDELLVIYDDISMDTGRLRIRKKGSAGGHNGMKSIIARLGTNEFNRIKIGVGDKPRGWDLADYVLGRFGKEEEALMREALGSAARACESILLEGADAAMNHFN